MKIITYKIQVVNGKVLITDSTGEHIASNDPTELLEFLIEPYENTIKIFWSLDDTIAPVLRTLGEKICKRLAMIKKSYCPPVNIFYVPRKVFSLTHVASREIKSDFYGIDQYFPEVRAPGTPEEIHMLGEKLLYELAKMGLRPSKLTSPIAIYEQCVMSQLDLPTAKDMPQEASKYAMLCSGKLWIEAYKLGHWPIAFDYDIKSSFPSILMTLKDIRMMNWIKSEQYMSMAEYGYADCLCTIYDHVKVSPVVVMNEDGSSSTPTGTFPMYLRKQKIDFIRHWNIGEVKIIDGWWAIPKIKNIPAPLALPLFHLLKYKERTGLQSLLAKAMSVGIYGKTGEQHSDGVGDYFNPCWFAETSDEITLQVAEFIYQNKLQEHLIHVSVDGVLLDCEVKL